MNVVNVVIVVLTDRQNFTASVQSSEIPLEACI